MDEAVIKDVLADHRLTFRSGHTVIGTIRRGVGAYRNGLASTMGLMKDHVLSFAREGLAIIPMADLNGALVEKHMVVLENGDIKEIRMRMKRLHFELTVITDAGPIIYTLRKRAVGCPWHRENLASMLSKATTE